MSSSRGQPGALISDPFPWPDIEADASVGIGWDVNLQQRGDPGAAFQNVDQTLAEFDLRYANLEGYLDRPGENDIPGKDRWKHSHEEMVTGVTASWFDLVGGANNVNYGKTSVSNTVDVLERGGIEHTVIGIGSESARAPAIVTVADTTVGFLQRTARYYGGKPWPPRNPGGGCVRSHSRGVPGANPR